MKTYFYILFFVFFLAGCEGKREKKIKQKDSLLESEHKDTNRKSAYVLEVNNDTLYQDFDRIIKEKAAQRNIIFEVNKLDSTAIFAPMDVAKDSKYNINEYLYYINNDTYTKFNFNIIETLSDAEAYNFIQKMKQVAAAEEPFKTTFYSFRISNKIYTFRCTANISHIRLEISKEICRLYEILDDNIAEL